MDRVSGECADGRPGQSDRRAAGCAWMEKSGSFRDCFSSSAEAGAREPDCLLVRRVRKLVHARKNEADYKRPLSMDPNRWVDGGGSSSGYCDLIFRCF